MCSPDSRRSFRLMAGSTRTMNLPHTLMGQRAALRSGPIILCHRWVCKHMQLSEERTCARTCLDSGYIKSCFLQKNRIDGNIFYYISNILIGLMSFISTILFIVTHKTKTVGLRSTVYTNWNDMILVLQFLQMKLLAQSQLKHGSHFNRCWNFLMSSVTLEYDDPCKGASS